MKKASSETAASKSKKAKASTEAVTLKEVRFLAERLEEAGFPAGSIKDLRAEMAAAIKKVTGEFQRLTAEESEDFGIPEDNSPVADPLEQAARFQDMDVEKHLQAKGVHALGGLTRNMQKIRDSILFVCDRCGGPNHPGRIDIVPESPFCVKCADMKSSSFDREEADLPKDFAETEEPDEEEGAPELVR